MGGAGGHMKHPFEVQGISSGVDLLNMFNTIVRVISENQPTLKLDGANTSFKVINSQSNSAGLEFALDRGSQSLEDIEGITLTNMRSRFLNSVDMKITDAFKAPELIGLEFSKRADWVAKNTNAPDTIQPGSSFSITKKFTLNRRKMPPISVEVLGIREHGLIATTTTQLNLLNRVFEIYPSEAISALQTLGMVDESGSDASSKGGLVQKQFDGLYGWRGLVAYMTKGIFSNEDLSKYLCGETYARLDRLPVLPRSSLAELFE